MTLTRRHAYLRTLGVVPWVLRGASPPPADDGAADVPAACEVRPAGDVATMDWPRLRTAVAGCQRCGLHRGRKQTVFGVGDTAADWMIVGEAPGAEEDRRGEPFVGRAGRLLDAMLQAVGLSRERVFIANVLKCRPPNNRDPAADEAAACADYLNRQIELLQPRIMLALGRVAAQRLLATDAPLGRLRGRVHRYPALDVPLVVTYHPAYLLRKPGDKRKAWNDLLLACRVAAGTEGAT